MLNGAAIERAVYVWLTAAANRPQSSFSHGTEVVLYPMCVSGADSTYVRAEATPFTDGEIGQDIAFYLQRGPDGYRVRGVDFLIGPRGRPRDVPLVVWRDLQRPACGLSVKAIRELLKLRTQHKIPDFTF